MSRWARCLLIALLSLGCEQAADVTPMPASLSGAESGDGKLHVTFFEVGHSEATLIVSPTGRSVLIGSGDDEARSRLSSDLAARTQGSLDLYFSWEADPEGLATLRRAMKVRQRVAVRGWEDPEGFAVQPGPVTLGGGVSLEFLGGAEAPVAIRVIHGAISLLVMRRELKTTPGVATVLRAPSAAAAESLSLAQVNAIGPKLVVVSVGAKNPDRAPDAAMLRRFEATGAQVLRTDLDGTLELLSDGERLSVTVSRPPAGELLPETVHLPPRPPEDSQRDVEPVGTMAFEETAEPEPLPAKKDPPAPFKPRYVARSSDPYFHMPDCRSVMQLKREQLRVFRTRAEAARKLKPAPDCNP